jgi:multidrug efflux system outer membrane protein
MNKYLLLLLIGTALVLHGCMNLAPDYTRPEAPVTSTFPADPACREEMDKTGKMSLAEVPWQNFFTDNNLRQLISIAFENNRDLRVAALNIERARAQYRIQRAEIFPSVNASGVYTKEHLPADISGTGKAQTVEQYNVGLGTSLWEIDFFGRIRNLKEKALEEFFASEEGHRSAQISLIGEVAKGYLLLAADQELLELAKQTLKSYQETYDLTRKRFEIGLASALEVRQAQTSVESTRVDIARYVGLVAEDKNALGVLIGTLPPTELLPQKLSGITALKEIPAGVPSEVLQDRPDILAAEHQLKGAYANIGAARAAFFPRIALTASGGFASKDLSNLFTSSSRAWSFVPRLDLPIFNAGELRARLRVSQVDREIYLARYEKVIQNAFREVANSLVRQKTIDNQLTAQRSLVEATAESYRLSEVRFSKGIDSFLNVLDSQRSYYGSQQNLIRIRLSRLNNLVTLYNVFGGGSSDKKGTANLDTERLGDNVPKAATVAVDPE